MYGIEPDPASNPWGWAWPMVERKAKNSSNNRRRGFGAEDTEKATAIKEYLAEHPEDSMRAVARAVGCSDRTVRKVVASIRSLENGSSAVSDSHSSPESHAATDGNSSLVRTHMRTRNSSRTHDPKQAELSRLPHTITLDENGEAISVITALKGFASTITYRQKVLNDYSEKTGNAVHWWDINMHPCFLFIDEYVALRAILPKKNTKDGDYSLETFGGILKRIATMGASAGAFCIISIAEASVQEGGLPSMLRSAMSTRILFRPSKAEGLLLWDKEKIENLPERIYRPGDSWFSSTDGLHDLVSFVHFPNLEIPIYRELGNALESYYSNRNS